MTRPDFVNVDGVRLACRWSGPEGAPVVLLIHGYTGQMRNWALNVPTLADAGFRTLSVDLPGHGDSGAPANADRYALDQIADDLVALTDRLECADACIVGHSMGGAIAEEYAIRRSATLAALVLVDSAGGASGPERSGWGDLLPVLEGADAVGGMGAVFDELVARGLRPAAAETTVERRALLRREFARTSFPGFRFGAEALRDRRETLLDLATLTCPVLVCHGSEESPALIAVSDDLATSLPHAERAVISGAGHNPQFETPQPFNALLVNFLLRAHGSNSTERIGDG